jgi:hypothetical protein
MKQELNIEKSSYTVAVLHGPKGYGALALAITAAGVIVAMSDVDGTQSASHCQSPDAGRVVFNNSLESSVSNGLAIGFLGKPNNPTNS